MSNVALQIAVIVLLILLNGFFAMSETALVSSRKARLRQRAEEGARGARTALELAASPNRFLSTVQIGISLIGVRRETASSGRGTTSRLWTWTDGASTRY